MWVITRTLKGKNSFPLNRASGAKIVKMLNVLIDTTTPSITVTKKSVHVNDVELAS
jgi:hypothetical protein